jgi:hypothetical protein
VCHEEHARWWTADRTREDRALELGGTARGASGYHIGGGCDMRTIPQGQMNFGNDWVTGLIQIPRGEYRDKPWNGISWPLVWCESDQRWYVGRRRLAEETLGISEAGLRARLTTDPVVSQGAKVFFVPSVSGIQQTACFLFDDLPYVLQGIEPNACRLEVRQDLIYFKGLSRDILRDVLIYGKVPEVLKERQQESNLDLVQLRQEVTAFRMEMQEVIEHARIIRLGYNGILLRDTHIREPVDGVNYTVINRAVRCPGRSDLVYASFGEVAFTDSLDEVVRKTLMASRYNGAKHGGDWMSWHAHYSDRRKKMQGIYHDFLLGAGCVRVSGRIDVFWVPQWILNDSRCVPEYIRMNELKQFIEDHRLFRTPMEAHANQP